MNDFKIEIINIKTKEIVDKKSYTTLSKCLMACSVLVDLLDKDEMIVLKKGNKVIFKYERA